jgi:two-component system, NtrC family, sensor histidine kinase HydH
MSTTTEAAEAREPAAGPKPAAKTRRSWTSRGSLPMAILAALALVATVSVAQRTLTEASDVVVRGEADSLAGAVLGDLAESEAPPTAADLVRELTEHEAKGLRYVALMGREGAPIVEAGDARLAGRSAPHGVPVIADERARVVVPIMPRRRSRFLHRLPDGSRMLPDGTRILPNGTHVAPSERAHPPIDGPQAPPADGPRPDRGAHFPMLLAIEIEPPVLARLRGGLMRISVTAALAGAVLVAFGVAFSRSARRLAEVEAQAAREQRLVALGTMSSVMAHELRNPLASLKGHAQLLAEDLDDARQRAKAERVVAEAVRIEELTTSLLDFVRDGPVDIEAISPADLLDRALHDLPRERLDIHLERAPKTVELDATRVARALHNIVQNGLQASAEGEKVDLSVTVERGELVFRVRDRGEGIPVGAEAHIFEAFVTTRVRGVGLGLSVARRIAEQHGGSLVGANHAEGGAEFVLRLARTMERV